MYDPTEIADATQATDGKAIVNRDDPAPTTTTPAAPANVWAPRSVSGFRLAAAVPHLARSDALDQFCYVHDSSDDVWLPTQPSRAPAPLESLGAVVTQNFRAEVLEQLSKDLLEGNDACVRQRVQPLYGDWPALDRWWQPLHGDTAHDATTKPVRLHNPQTGADYKTNRPRLSTPMVIVTLIIAAILSLIVICYTQY